MGWYSFNSKGCLRKPLPNPSEDHVINQICDVPQLLGFDFIWVKFGLSFAKQPPGKLSTRTIFVQTIQKLELLSRSLDQNK